MGESNAAGIGHNTLGGDQLRSIVERVERLEEEKAATSSDIRDIYAEAKSNGYDVKALRAIIRMRRQDSEERAAHEYVVATYLHALGMLAELPLGQAALRREGLAQDEVAGKSVADDSGW